MNIHSFLSSSRVLIAALVLGLGLSACTEQQNADTGTRAGSTGAMSDTGMSGTAMSDTLGRGMAHDSTMGGGVVHVKQSQKVGAYLADADGRTLYLFLKDQQGSGKSTCYDACAEEWPPFTMSKGGGAPMARGEAADSLLGTLQRRDGTTQVTYNGWPLYYYEDDQSAGQLNGQDIEDYGAEWYVLTPQGTAAGHEEEE